MAFLILVGGPKVFCRLDFSYNTLANIVMCSSQKEINWKVLSFVINYLLLTNFLIESKRYYLYACGIEHSKTEQN
jgi:hypothetical protein